MFHLFSKKKKTGEPFLFRIEDTFAMKNGDCVLAGEVTKGSIHAEDEVQYLDAKAKDPDTPYPQNPAWDKIPKAFDVETDPYLQTSQGQTWFKNTLSNRKTSFKRNRDLCYIVMAAIYAINIIDATVYAHFYDFEIDDNLSFNLQPTSSYSPVSGGSIGLTLTFNF